MSEVAEHRHGGGRRPLADGEETTRVHLSLCETMYDRIYLLAQAERVSVPEFIRIAIAKLLESESTLPH